MIRFLPWILLCGFIVSQAHARLDASPRKDTSFDKEVMPSTQASKLISLGYENVVADYYWLRSISHFGDRRMHAHEYPNLLGLLELVLALDPKFGAGYFFAGSVLNTSGDHLEDAMRILKTGRAERPDNWRIPYILGFNYYMYYQDFEKAAQSFAEAARHPDAPSVLGKLAVKLAAESQTPEIGIAMIDTILGDIQDETLREVYIERRNLLMLEQELLSFQRIIDQYIQRFGQPPSTLKELVQTGLLRQLPQNDPVGGTYYISETGRAATTSEDKRLRLSTEAKEKLQ
tara:strand:- start:339 stop:1202 length:864 start_codon:yes stop_codon:yes gene_type:complete